MYAMRHPGRPVSIRWGDGRWLLGDPGGRDAGAETLAALEQIEGWVEHRDMIRTHLERAQKRKRELEQRMWTSRINGGAP
jgi:hypothetical protein